MFYQLNKKWIVIIILTILFQINLIGISGKTINFEIQPRDLIKTIHPPNIEWDITQGGSEFDSCYSVKQSDDGGFVFAGGSYSFGPGLSDLWIIKTDNNGLIMWNKTYGGPRNESCYCIQKTLDGCFIVTGKTKIVEPDNYDAILLKIDSDGTELWNKTYGGDLFDASWWVEPDLDGGYMLVGNTESKGNGDGDIWVIKTDSTGSLIWDKTFGREQFEEAEEVLVLDDGSLIILGSTESFGSGGNDLYLLKIDSIGNLIWERVYGGNLDDEGWSIESGEDNCFFILGRTNSFGAGNQDFWFLKTNEAGDILINRTFGGASFDQARRIRKTDDGIFLLIGTTESFDAIGADYWLIAIDNDGYAIWDMLIGSQYYDIGYDVQKTDDSGFILTGITYNSFNSGDAWFVKLFPFENQQPKKPDRPFGETELKPNQDFVFSSKTLDSDGNDIYYRWNWGDGNISEWIGPFKSNENCEESHSWKEKGDYQIKVQAKDSNGGESPWSEPLKVNVPRNRFKMNHLRYRFIDNFWIILRFLNFEINL